MGVGGGGLSNPLPLRGLLTASLFAPVLNGVVRSFPTHSTYQLRRRFLQPEVQGAHVCFVFSFPAVTGAWGAWRLRTSVRGCRRSKNHTGIKMWVEADRTEIHISKKGDNSQGRERETETES